MEIIKIPTSKEKLIKMAERFSGGLVKAVVDIEKEILAIDAPMHADLEKVLLENGSFQDNLWGINLYPDLSGEDFIEYDSMINVRPRLNNFSRGVESKELQAKIVTIVEKLIT
jgi:hypothetical protein